jgi:hypothetical protein
MNCDKEKEQKEQKEEEQKEFNRELLKVLCNIWYGKGE